MTEERRAHSTDTAWEQRVGYARAVRLGRHVHVSGTLGSGPGGAPPAGAYEQSVAAFGRIGEALAALGASFADVVRTRMYVVDLDQHHEGVGRAHREFLGGVRPASSMVGVAALIAPEYVVEIEVEALLPA